MGLPFPIFNIISKGQTLVYHGRLYKFSFHDPGCKENFLKLGELKFPIVELERLAKLEEIYEEDNKDRILELQTNAIKEYKQSSTFKLTIKELYSEIKLLDLFIKKVVPFFIDSSKLKDLFTFPLSLEEIMNRDKNSKEGYIDDQKFLEEVPDSKYSKRNNESSSDPIARMIRKRRQTGNIKQKKQTEKKDIEEIKEELLQHGKRKKSILEEKVFENKNIIIFDHLIFELIPNKEQDPNEALYINGDIFKWGFKDIISDVKSKYLDELKKFYITSAIENQPQKILLQNLLTSYYKKLEYVRKHCQEVDLNKLNSKQMNFCLKILDKYALKGDDVYYKFGPTTIAVKVSYVNEQSGFEISSPFVLPKYEHPFLWGKTSNQTMCIGSQKYTASETGAKIAERLNIGRDTLLHGYFGDVGPRRHLESSIFPHHKISKEEAEKIGITNKRR